MWNYDGFFFICVVLDYVDMYSCHQIYHSRRGYLLAFTDSAGLFGTLLGDNDNNNYNNRPSNPTIPLISSLGFGSNNREETYRPNNNEYVNNNPNRGILPLLGVNTNNNRPNVNNLNNNRFTNTAQSNANNINDLKKQFTEAERLLERLKEKNRLKEQQRLEDEKNQQQITNKEAETNKNQIEEETKEGTVLKSVSRKKFFTIVKPVVPDDEAMNFTETVYYFD